MDLELELWFVGEDEDDALSRFFFVDEGQAREYAADNNLQVFWTEAHLTFKHDLELAQE